MNVGGRGERMDEGKGEAYHRLSQPIQICDP
jgi:hypothetical protein